MELCSLPAIYLGPNYYGGNEDNGNCLQKIPYMYCYTQCPQPCSRPPLTHASAGDSWTLTGKSGSVLWGHCSFLLHPGAHKVLFVPFNNLFPQFCVSSGGPMVGLMATFFQEGLCHTHVYCTQSSCPCGSPPCLYRRHSNIVLSQSLWGLWVLVCTKFV